MGPFTVQALSALLLLVCSLLDLVSNLMFTGRRFLGWFDGTPTFVHSERGLLIAAYLLAALGVTLLELVLRDTDGAILARLGLTAFVMAAVLAIVAEAAMLGGQSALPLVVIMVVALFVAEAILGGALLGSGHVPAWVGWTVVVWSIGWLIVLPLASPADIYYPALHFLPLLLIGITLLIV